MAASNAAIDTQRFEFAVSAWAGHGVAPPPEAGCPVQRASCQPWASAATGTRCAFSEKLQTIRAALPDGSVLFITKNFDCSSNRISVRSLRQLARLGCCLRRD